MPALTFVYNADSGLGNALLDLIHKTVAPSTYACSLCQITYSPLGMRKAWKRFLGELRARGFELVFLHRDEVSKDDETPLPVIYDGPVADASVLLSADAICACGDVEELQTALLRALEPES